MITETFTNPTQRASLECVKSTIKNEWKTLNKEIKQSLKTESQLHTSDDIVDHILTKEGKRLRPLLSLLIAKSLAPEISPAHFGLASAIELTHIATLLHDDVIDQSAMRRNQASINNQWGNHAAVLGGDFIYSRAMQILVEIAPRDILSILTKTINMLVEGELVQLSNKKQIINEAQYQETIYRKTAALFEAACHCSAILSNASPDITIASRVYGKQVGLAFQIIDDILDYTAKRDVLGKATGTDLREQKSTLPLIYTFEALNPSDQQTLSNLFKSEPDDTAIKTVRTLMDSTNAIERCFEQVKHHHDIARQQLKELPSNHYTEQLEILITFNEQRFN